MCITSVLSVSTWSRCSGAPVATERDSPTEGDGPLTPHLVWVPGVFVRDRRPAAAQRVQGEGRGQAETGTWAGRGAEGARRAQPCHLLWALCLKLGDTGSVTGLCQMMEVALGVSSCSCRKGLVASAHPRTCALRG